MSLLVSKVADPRPKDCFSLLTDSVNSVYRMELWFCTTQTFYILFSVRAVARLQQIPAVCGSNGLFRM